MLFEQFAAKIKIPAEHKCKGIGHSIIGIDLYIRFVSDVPPMTNTNRPKKGQRKHRFSK